MITKAHSAAIAARTTFGEMIAIKEGANEVMMSASATLNQLRAGNLDDMGITLPHVKASPEWKAADALFKRSSECLKTANAVLRRHFKNELAGYHKAKFGR